MKKVTVYLVGATGNQLFELFAGLSLAIQHDAELVFDTSLLQPAKNRHPGGIEDFIIWVNDRPLKYRIRKFRKPGVLVMSERIIYKIMNSSTITRRMTKQFRSKVVGYDVNLSLKTPSCLIFGFFQTYRYVGAVKSASDSLRIELAKPSPWFVEMSQNIKRINSSVGIHLRRGDYYLHKDLLGMLTDEYFISVLAEIETSQVIEKVFIFSDSLESAQILRTRIGVSKCEVVIPPNVLNPAESMILLSLCGFQIISNSSFSWWAAYISENSNKVFAPEPWFRNQTEPIMLIPDEWQKRRSIWFD